MANRTGNKWDEGCLVDHIIDGEATMTAIYHDFKNIIDEAGRSSQPFGERGYVFIAGWRLNPNRIIHHTDASGKWELYGEPQDPEDVEVDHDFTVLEMIKNMMEAGIKVRILLFMPPSYKSFIPHAADHFYFASLIKSFNKDLKVLHPECSNDIGIVFLDARFPTETTQSTPISSEPISSHHQKFIVIRGLENHVAYCGGVDLAYTRRNSFKFEGDIQSGDSIPARDNNINMQEVTAPKEGKQGSDLPEEVYGQGGAKARFQIWHDQHLRLCGPIVSTLEKIFVQRWNDYGPVTAIPDGSSMIKQILGGLISSSANAAQKKKEKGILWGENEITIPKPLENTVKLFDPITEPAQPVYGICGISDIGEPGRSKVQVWQTMPRLGLRVGKKLDGEFCDQGEDYPYQDGEFSLMAGIAKAIESSQDLIFIFDQYYWLLPHAASLIKQLCDKPNLHIIIILPPISDDGNEEVGIRQHTYRKNALDFFVKFGNYIAEGRVLILNLWSYEKKRGIYCHAKVHAFDQALLVCGSANINWRSFTNDTELNCAVLDKDVVQNFYRNMWRYLFNESKTIDFDNISWGAVFFTQFKEKFNETKENGNLIKDIFTDPDSQLPPSDFSAAGVLQPDKKEKRNYWSKTLVFGTPLYGTLDPIAIDIPREKISYYEDDYEKQKKKQEEISEKKYKFEWDLSKIVNRLETNKNTRLDPRWDMI